MSRFPLREPFRPGIPGAPHIDMGQLPQPRMSPHHAQAEQAGQIRSAYRLVEGRRLMVEGHINSREFA